MNTNFADSSFGCFALELLTEQGYSLGVGGICHPAKADYWSKVLTNLKSLHVHQSDIFQIDYALAQTLESLSEDSLIVVGATLCVEGLDLPADVRTGGVIGCPRCPIVSANADCEDLPEGFAQCAVPGGPGLVAQASKAAVERALHQIQVTCTTNLHETKILNILHSAGIYTGLLVFDGTGESAPGYLLVFTDNHFHCVSLKAKSCL